MGKGFLLVLLVILLLLPACQKAVKDFMDETKKENLNILGTESAESTPESPPELYLVLTVDAEEKEELLGIHGGVFDAMLDTFEREGLKGRVEILMPVDDWRVAVEDNLSVVKRVNEYPISLHSDRHEKFVFQDREVQRHRIFSSIEEIRKNFNYSGDVFRAPSLMEGETTRDILEQANISYDLTPQIYPSDKTMTFFPVRIRKKLKLLPTSLIITGGFPSYSMSHSKNINSEYMESFDRLYQQARETGPLVAVALLHPTNWNNQSIKLLEKNLEYMKSKPGVKFITAEEISSYVPVLGKNPLEFSPKVGVLVDPREDYSRNKTSFSDESFLLYALRSYGIDAQRAKVSELEDYDRIVYYSPTGKNPPIDEDVVVLNETPLEGMTPRDLLSSREKEEAGKICCRLLSQLVELESFSSKAVSDARARENTPYLDRALKSDSRCQRIKFAYLSREYSIQTGATSKLSKPQKYSLVKEDVPKIYYGTVDGVELGYQVAPHGIAKAARESFYAYERTGNRENLSRALYLVDYLLNSSVDKGNYLVWEYSFPWPPYGLEEGWRGSLAQAGALKALMLAHKHTGEKRYLLASRKALHAFSVPLGEGGLLWRREGYPWYPEYGKEHPPYVLNGFITTLMWLKEYSEYTDSSEAERLYKEGVKSLVRFLPRYDAPEGSYYDVLGNRASEHYHDMHVWQMGVMYNLTGREIFREYKKRWEEH